MNVGVQGARRAGPSGAAARAGRCAKGIFTTGVRCYAAAIAGSIHTISQW